MIFIASVFMAIDDAMSRNVQRILNVIDAIDVNLSVFFLLRKIK